MLAPGPGDQKLISRFGVGKKGVKDVEGRLGKEPEERAHPEGKRSKTGKVLCLLPEEKKEN